MGVLRNMLSSRMLRVTTALRPRTQHLRSAYTTDAKNEWMSKYGYQDNEDVVKLGKNSFVEIEGSNYQGSSLRLSDDLLSKVTRNLLNDIDLIVCDMAGTTVQEGGLVYQVLRESMVEDGLEVSESEMHPWHGAKKEAVIAHFARRAGTAESEIDARVAKIGDIFLRSIDDAYFAEASPIDHIDLSLTHFIAGLQAAGIKVGFDTGYPPEIQEGLLNRLNLKHVIDGYVSAYTVKAGRPYPYMIFKLMEDLDVMDVKRVCKVGDSVRDIEEGKNAGCGLVVGVLSGADSEDKLMEAGADIVVPCVTDLPIPVRKHVKRRSSMVDLS